MTSDLFFQALVPFVSLLIGAAITYNVNRGLADRNARKQRSIALYEEFHGKEMLQCRFDAAMVLRDNPSGNIAALYKDLSLESYLPLSKLFHWIEKVGVYHKNGQVDGCLLKQLLGRYFYEWYTLHYERLTHDLSGGSEFVDMMNEVKYVADTMGRESDARYYTQGGGA